MLEYFEEILPVCNPYGVSYLECKELSAKATGPAMCLNFHDNTVTNGEHTTSYNG